MSICEISRFAMSFTIQTRAPERNIAATPRIQLSVGSRKNKIIFKKPVIRIAPINGKTNTVQMLTNRLIV